MVFLDFDTDHLDIGKYQAVAWNKSTKTIKLETVYRGISGGINFSYLAR